VSIRFDSAAAIAPRPERAPRLDEARSLLDIATTALEDGWPEKARRFARRALTSVDRNPPADNALVAEIVLCLAVTYEDSEEYVLADAHYQRASCIANGVAKPGTDLDGYRLRIRATCGLGNVARALGRYRKAETVLKEALAQAEWAFGLHHREVALVMDHLAVLYRTTDRPDNAYRLHRSALAIAEKVPGGIGSRDVAAILQNLAALETARGDVERAEPFARRAVAICDQTFGPDHGKSAAARSALAAILERQGKFDEAEVLYRRALTTFTRWFGADHRQVALARSSLTALLGRKARSESEADLATNRLPYAVM